MRIYRRAIVYSWILNEIILMHKDKAAFTRQSIKRAQLICVHATTRPNDHATTTTTTTQAAMKRTRLFENAQMALFTYVSYLGAFLLFPEVNVISRGWEAVCYSDRKRVRFELNIACNEAYFTLIVDLALYRLDSGIRRYGTVRHRLGALGQRPPAGKSKT